MQKYIQTTNLRFIKKIKVNTTGGQYTCVSYITYINSIFLVYFLYYLYIYI